MHTHLDTNTADAAVDLKPKGFNAPKDWPQDGPIDLNIHDLPHHSASTEWWYANSHLKTKCGKTYSLFASFFRKLVDIDEKTETANYAYSVTWALIDVKDEAYYVCSMIDKHAPEIGLEQLKKGKIIKDNLLRRAGIELLEKGNVPFPDRLMQEEAVCAMDKLFLDFDGNTYEKIADKTYQLKLVDDEQNIYADVTLKLQKPPIRHGDNGVVRGVKGEDMFYYFIPSCSIEGTIVHQGKTLEIDPENSSAWYDHEFGCHTEELTPEQIENPDTEVGKGDVSWNWISFQLAGNYQVTAYDLFNEDKDYENCGKFAIVIGPDGKQTNYTEFTLEPFAEWTSMKTFNKYPTHWTLVIPGANIEVDVEASFPEQEFMTVISKPAFWEGRIKVKGFMNGEPIEGPGFIERSGFVGFDGLHDFFKAVGKETRKSIRDILPFEPNEEQAAKLVASIEDKHYLKGIDTAQFSRTIIQPIREIIDRGGKAWRSYLPLACCDVVGGNSQEAAPWLALPELLHVGSLIVDDVEDRSDIRRGKKACHLIYGEATAINAGTAAYFLGQDFIYKSDVPVEDKLDIYNLYFKAMRAAHSGQAIDIDGFAHVMPEIVKSGDGQLLEDRVMAIHLLKAAAPASFLGQMGVILGKGTPEQKLGVAEYLEAVGTAFQIIDDVLNLRGFPNDLKAKGEDISHGKITLPLAKAMRILPHEERHRIWVIVSSKPKNQEVIDEVVKVLEDCGALKECEEQATKLVEDAWHKLDPLVRDSFAKLMLRAFGWFVLERDF